MRTSAVGHRVHAQPRKVNPTKNYPLYYEYDGWVIFSNRYGFYQFSERCAIHVTSELRPKLPESTSAIVASKFSLPRIFVNSLHYNGRIFYSGRVPNCKLFRFFFSGHLSTISRWSTRTNRIIHIISTALIQSAGKYHDGMIHLTSTPPSATFRMVLGASWILMLAKFARNSTAFVVMTKWASLFVEPVEDLWRTALWRPWESTGMSK